MAMKRVMGIRPGIFGLGQLSQDAKNLVEEQKFRISLTVSHLGCTIGAKSHTVVRRDMTILPLDLHVAPSSLRQLKVQCPTVPQSPLHRAEIGARS